MSRFEFEFSIPAEHPALAGHFPGQPIVPGVLIIDQVLAALQPRCRLDRVYLQHVRFSSVLLPGQQVRVLCDVVGPQVTFAISSATRPAETIFASGKLVIQSPSDETLDA